VLFVIRRGVQDVGPFEMNQRLTDCSESRLLEAGVNLLLNVRRALLNNANS
jgi:hypothetical protein